MNKALRHSLLLLLVASLLVVGHCDQMTSGYGILSSHHSKDESTFMDPLELYSAALDELFLLHQDDGNFLDFDLDQDYDLIVEENDDGEFVYTPVRYNKDVDTDDGSQSYSYMEAEPLHRDDTALKYTAATAHGHGSEETKAADVKRNGRIISRTYVLGILFIAGGFVYILVQVIMKCRAFCIDRRKSRFRY